MEANLAAEGSPNLYFKLGSPNLKIQSWLGSGITSVKLTRVLKTGFKIKFKLDGFKLQFLV